MYSLDFLATISNCDAEGRLKLCSALQMMQDCSELWIDSEPVVKRCFGERHMAQLLVFRQVEDVRVPRCRGRRRMDRRALPRRRNQRHHGVHRRAGRCPGRGRAVKLEVLPRALAALRAAGAAEE